MKMGEFNSDDHYIYYHGQESLRRNGVTLLSTRVWKTAHGCNFKNDRMNSVCFQGKAFSITVIQVYVPTRNAEEAEVERFYEDLQDLLELTPKKGPFHYRGLECKSRESRDTWNNRQVWPWRTKLSKKRSNSREGNGTLLQYSCLENPMDGGAWWAAVYGVAQSWTWLKQLSSSSSRLYMLISGSHFIPLFLTPLVL